MLDNHKCEVEFVDGTTGNCCANVIAEKLFAQVDGKGRQFLVIKEIADCEKDNAALTMENGCIAPTSGNKQPKRTTRGWKLLVDGKDGMQDWLSKCKEMANGNKTGNAWDSHASIVSQKTVRIAFLCSVLNGLDMANAHLNAPCKEQYWIKAGPKWGSNRGAVMLMHESAHGALDIGNSWQHWPLGVRAWGHSLVFHRGGSCEERCDVATRNLDDTCDGWTLQQEGMLCVQC